MKKIILYMTLCLIGMVQVACDQDIDGMLLINGVL